jgi:hypothetical protein
MNEEQLAEELNALSLEDFFDSSWRYAHRPQPPLFCHEGRGQQGRSTAGGELPGVLQIFLHFLGQGWNHLEQVPDHTVVCLLENGGIRVLVDGNDQLGGGHARQMLNGP